MFSKVIRYIDQWNRAETRMALTYILIDSCLCNCIQITQWGKDMFYNKWCKDDRLYIW